VANFSSYKKIKILYQYCTTKAVLSTNKPKIYPLLAHIPSLILIIYLVNKLPSFVADDCTCICSVVVVDDSCKSATKLK
jgi:hypothetical protein